MPSRLLSVVVALLVFGSPVTAGVIAVWDFDAQVTTPTDGRGTMQLRAGVATTTPAWVTGVAPSVYSSYALRTKSYPTQSQGNKTAGVEFAVSTGGYTDISVSFDKKHSSTPSRYMRFQYTTNGSTWLDNAPNSLMMETGTSFSSFSFDLSSFSAADDNTNFKFRIVAEFDPNGAPPSQYTATSSGSTYNPTGTIAFENVVVSGTRIAQDDYIEDVPDVNQPAADPLSLPSFDNTNYCAPTSALNITEYWDVVMGSSYAGSVDGNPNPGPTSAVQFIGWWMNTNNVGGCPFRINGNPTGYAGTVFSDIPAGLMQYVRWDSTHNFGCTPPTLLNGKLGYDWSITRVGALQTTWNDMTTQIDSGQPLIICWPYWNPINGYYNPEDGYTYYGWGTQTSGSSSSDPSETWNANADIGHATTLVGYKKDYDPHHLGQIQDWVIVHDNWYSTDRDVAIPWGIPGQSIMGMVFVDPSSTPSSGTLIGTPAAGNPGNHTGWIGGADTMARISLTANATEDVLAHAMDLTASGTGNDAAWISRVDIVQDRNNDGVCSTAGGDLIVGTHVGGYSQDNGTMTVQIPDSKLQVNASSTVNLFIVYYINMWTPTNPPYGTYAFTITKVYATGCGSFASVPVVDVNQPPGAFTFTSCVMNAQLHIMPVEDTDIGKWKGFPNGAYGFKLLPIRMCPITSVDNDRIYVMENNGSAGIRLMFQTPPPTLDLGAQIGFEGIIQTIDGERVIVCDSPPVMGQTGPERPLAMSNKSIGGGDFAYEGISGAGQKGVAGGVGLNNVGMLARTTGTVMDFGPDCFYMNDGSFLPGQPNLKVILAPVVAMPTAGAQICVTGVISTELEGGELRSVIRTRIPGDIWPP